MLNKNLVRKTLASCLLVAVWSVSSMMALAAGDNREANVSITVAGNVKVNDRAAVSNTTVVSGSTITTGETGDSVATVDLGKLGRVQLLSQSSLVLKFDENGIYPTLLVGKVRVMNMSGISATVTTKEGLVMGDAAQANTFAVETECGRMIVNTTVGSAMMRAAGEDKSVAAGNEAVAGSLQQTGCRPCTRPDPNAVFPALTGGLALGVLVPLVIGAGVATVFLANTFGNDNNEVETGNTGIVVSPTR